ncbi:RCC1 domain-containing protein 1 [Acropora cervicornis]|uniref:RCC1 domain-containing protein 1 n=1 Tax=Acropora cervicornis TaxID=6130 RepID=A0AAD9VFK4_ACRCE|nr:RCC1 domain-containing protein 1 [Acropora cervicornis]
MAATERGATTDEADDRTCGYFDCYGFGYNGFSQINIDKSANEVDGNCLSTAPVHVALSASARSEVFTPLTLNVGRVHDVVASWSSNIYLKENGIVSVSGWIPGTRSVGKQDNLLPGFFVTDISSSWMLLAFLTQDGECLVWNNYTSETSGPVKVNTSCTKFKAVGCREKSCILVTDKGHVGSLVCEQDQDCLDSGKSEFLFKPMDVKAQISSVACGKEHTLLLSSSGDVYSLGGGSRGQLGRGLIVTEESPVIIVAALEGIRIQSIAAGGWHSAAISEFGDLYMWGWNEKGQLGLTVSHDDEEDRQSSIHQIQCQALPALVNLPGDLDVLTVSCGTRHTAIVAGDGSVWTWGWGKVVEIL